MNNLFEVLMYIIGGFILFLIGLGIYEAYMSLKEVKEDKRDNP